jgi:hypothetical protein
MYGFPHPTVQPIIRMPTYKKALRKLQLALNADALYFQSNLGNGLCSLLALSVSNTTLSGVSSVNEPLSEWINIQLQ